MHMFQYSIGSVSGVAMTFPDGGAQSFYRILSMITHRHAGSYVHLLKVVVCMEKA